jgi:hypothetical protein
MKIVVPYTAGGVGDNGSAKAHGGQPFPNITIQLNRGGCLRVRKAE